MVIHVENEVLTWVSHFVQDKISFIGLSVCNTYRKAVVIHVENEVLTWVSHFVQDKISFNGLSVCTTYRKAVVIHVENEVLTHDGQTNQSDICPGINKQNIIFFLLFVKLFSI